MRVCVCACVRAYDMMESKIKVAEVARLAAIEIGFAII